eukprot:1139512-Pelagomonas_calceolata.AAC.2
MLSVSMHSGQHAEVEDTWNLMACFRGLQRKPLEVIKGNHGIRKRNALSLMSQCVSLSLIDVGKVPVSRLRVLSLPVVNVPVSQKNLSRIKVGGPAWDRAHKDSIRAALVSGRGASTIKGNPVRENLGDASILRDDPYLPLLRALTQELRSASVPIGVHPTHCCVRTYKLSP